ncbi:MAG: PTS glucitol/sorbitol transporter subunit IIA [Hespellia sp.]|nr:PTS glucitol/sorbitol transporter subunit IIA [Hespellia sp.]
MTCIYENTVKGMGEMVEAFAEEGMFVLFGDNAPDTLKDFCYVIDVKNADQVIEAGGTMEFDGVSYKIMEVGEIMQRNLESLGHISVRFGGECLPGSVVLEETAEIPKLKNGSTIKIFA